MYHRILTRIQDLVSHGWYSLGVHAEQEQGRDWSWIEIEDIECAIVNGALVERQWDDDTDEWKYVLEGPTVAGERLGVVVKLSDDDVFIMTVYLIR